MYQSKLLYTALLNCAGNIKKELMHTAHAEISFMTKANK